MIVLGKGSKHTYDEGSSAQQSGGFIKGVKCCDQVNWRLGLDIGLH